MSAQLAFTYTPRFPAAEEWRRRNPLAYARIVALAQEDAAYGYCSMQTYIDALRSPALSRTLGVRWSDASYKVNHNLRSELTRLILSEYPSLPFRIRRSSVDDGATHATPEVRSA